MKSKTGAILFVFSFVGVLAGIFAFYGVIAYVVVHFIKKLW